MNRAFSDLIADILSDGSEFLAGIHRTSESPTVLTEALVAWAGISKRSLADVIAPLEPCIRQSILMALLPAKAFGKSYTGSLDQAIVEHSKQLSIQLTTNQVRYLRNICVNIRKMRGMDSKQARNISKTIGSLKALPSLYKAIFDRQKGRCRWCGINLDNPAVSVTLDHIVPKHLGNDLPDGSNWALSCSSCNWGKGEMFAWGASGAAHDYMARLAFEDVSRLQLDQRWVVLMRDKQCKNCAATTRDRELFVHRKFPSGLPIASNCSTTCFSCASHHKYEVLIPRWHEVENQRTIA
jgi:hypothetical protein